MTIFSNDLFRRAFYNAIKLSLVYLILGIVSYSLGYINNFAATTWNKDFHIVNVTTQAGHVFLLFALATFIYKSIAYFCFHFQHEWTAERPVASMIAGTLGKSLRIFYFLTLLKIIINFTAPKELYIVIANRVIETILIGFVGWIIIRILNTVEVVTYQRMQANKLHDYRSKEIYTKIHIIRNVTTIVIIILTIAAILMSYSSVRSVGVSLLASAGFLTAIIGFSAQKTLFSLFTGVQIALAQLIKIGDMVAIEGETGIIEEITLTYVTLKLGDQRRSIVPINFFIEKKFENWSHDINSIRKSFVLNVGYLMSIKTLRNEVDNILGQSPLWDKGDKEVMVSNINENGVQVRIQVSASNADNLANLCNEVREKILDYIQEHCPENFAK